MDAKTTAKFTFTTGEERPCRILPGQTRRELHGVFNPAAAPLDTAENGALNRAGFDKSLSLTEIFRQACAACNACKPARIVARDYRFSRGERHILNRNDDLRVAINPAPQPAEHQPLFLRNFEARHKDGYDPFMQFMIRHMFRVGPMLNHPLVPNITMEIRRDDTLLGAALYDDTGDGYKANYYYYAPEEPGARSLGTFLILQMIAQAQAADKPYVYLGALTREPSKISYKSRFRPLEILDGGAWVPYAP